MKKLLPLLFVLVVSYAQAQKVQLQIGTQIPLNYSVGLDFYPVEHIVFGLQGGVLTKPYDKALLSTLRIFGTDEVIVNTVGEAFSFGTFIQPTIKYAWGKNYLGGYYSMYALVAQDCPQDLIENYYGEDIPDRNNRRNTNTSEMNLTLNTRLHNAGILYGRKIALANPKHALHLEASLAKTFASSNRLSANGENLDRLSLLIQDALHQYFIDYGYLPSINVFWVMTL